MKMTLAILTILGTLALGAVQPADSDFTVPRPAGGWKSHAVCISVPEPSDVARFCAFIRNEFPARKIDTLVLLTRYAYQYKSHPEVVTEGAVSEAEMRQIRRACEESGVALIPKINALGHQADAGGKIRDGLLLAHPELDETPGKEKIAMDYHRSICPRHPDSLKIILDLVDELCDVCGAKAMHIGCDEVFEIGQCPRCQGTDPGKLYADWVNAIARHLKARGVKTLIWGDRLLDAKKLGYGPWEASQVGTETAIDLLDKDIIVCDWHYHCWKRFPSCELLAEKGYQMYVCPYSNSSNLVSFLKYATEHDKGQYLGAMQTTWCGARDFMDAVELKTPDGKDDSPEEQWLKPVGRNFRIMFPKVTKQSDKKESAK